MLANAGLRAANGCLYLAAGLLRQDELQAASEARWLQFGTAVADSDAGLAGEEKDFYTRYLSPADRVLLIGSGAGRDLLALHLLGYDVTGLEQVTHLAAMSRKLAERHGVTIPVYDGRIQTAELNGSFDEVIFSLGCYSYLQGRGARVAALRRVHEHLSPGGHVLLSYHPCEGGSAMARWLTHLSARLSRAGWTPEPGDVFSRDFLAPRVLRYQHEFEPRELVQEYAAAGFQIVADEPWGALRFAAAVRTGEKVDATTSARIASQTAGSAAKDRR
jgi:SAM-dependent methyltransferase